MYCFIYMKWYFFTLLEQLFLGDYDKMVEDIDINTNATISKYFWQKAMSGSIDVTSGEKDYTILFFEALPNDFYDLIEDGDVNRGKVKGNLENISGCKVLKNPDTTLVTKDFNGYPIFKNDGEEGFYIVMYDNPDGVEIIDPLTDINSRCINVVVPLAEGTEYTVKGFLIKDTNDYLICYSRFTNPTPVKNHIIFSKMSTILNVSLNNGVL